MTVAARTDTAEQRSAIFEALRSRNRLVALLRIGLPVIGGIIFAGLVLQLFLGSLSPEFGFASVRVDRENLVFESPSYAGMGADGTAYTLSAAAATAALSNTDLVDLSGAILSMQMTDGGAFSAEAQTAELAVGSQVVTVDGATTVSSSEGLSGTVGDAVVDVLNETLIAPGGTEITLSDGTDIRADALAFDGATVQWTFTGNVKLRFDETPGETAYQERNGTETPTP